MATITITEMLGSDNVAGSRITINENFKKVADAINTIENYLDTSFVPGAALNVGSALVKKYTRPITDQIFTCEATGLFGGNLNVSQDLGVTRDAVTGRHHTIHGNLVLDGTNAVGNKVTASIPFDVNAAFSSPQFYASATSNSLVIDPQTLTTPTTTSTTRNIVTTSTFPKTSVIRLNWSNYTGATTFNCDSIILPAVTDPNVTQGQILTVMVDNPAPSGTTGIDLSIDVTNLDSSYSSITFNTDPGVPADDARLRQAVITFVADTNGWRVLHAVGATVTIA
jgi:hypothetical protein